MEPRARNNNVSKNSSATTNARSRNASASSLIRRATVSLARTSAVNVPYVEV
jgi:hypothetical protein